MVAVPIKLCFCSRIILLITCAFIWDFLTDFDLSDRTVGVDNDIGLLCLSEITSAGLSKWDTTSAVLQPFNDGKMSDFIFNQDVLRRKQRSC